MAGADQDRTGSGQIWSQIALSGLIAQLGKNCITDANDRSIAPKRVVSDPMNPRKGLFTATTSLALGLTLTSLSVPSAHAQSPDDPYGQACKGKKSCPQRPAALTPVPSSAA